MYHRFMDILKLSKSGLNGDEIGRILRMNNVRKYLTGEKMSFLTFLRSERDKLGPPVAGLRWLPLGLKPRGTPRGKWVQVPPSPVNFESIDSVIQSMPMTVPDTTVLREFGFESAEELRRERTNLFGFLLGATVGDASKRVKGVKRFFSRALFLELSVNKPNSLRFGQFASLSANVTLDFGMHQLDNGPVSDKRFGKTEVYRWLSKSTPLMAWVFNGCLGLQNTETTTYDKLRMNWILEAPRAFRVSFFQGIGESDGWPDAGHDRVKLVASPNTVLFKRLLEGLGCRPLVFEQPPVQLLSIPTDEAFALPLFSPRIGSNLYHDMETLACAKRYPERVPLPWETIKLIQSLSRMTSNASKVCLMLAQRTGYKVNGQTVRKYARLV